MFHEVFELIEPIRQDLKSSGHATLAVTEQGLGDVVVSVKALGLHQLDQTSHRNRVGTHLSIEISSPLPRRPGRGDERANELIHPGSIPNGDGRRDPMPFLVDRHRVGRHRPWSLATDIGMVRPIGHPGDMATVGKHGSNDREIVEMGASVEGIVHGVLDSRLGIEAPDTGGNRLRHRAKMHRDVLGLRQHLPVGCEDGRRTVRPLLDVWR